MQAGFASTSTVRPTNRYFAQTTSAHLLADVAVRLRDRVPAEEDKAANTFENSGNGVLSDAEVDALISEAKSALETSLVITPRRAGTFLSTARTYARDVDSCFSQQ